MKQRNFKVLSLVALTDTIFFSVVSYLVMNVLRQKNAKHSWVIYLTWHVQSYLDSVFLASRSII